MNKCASSAIAALPTIKIIDKNISDTSSIIKKIEMKKSFSPNEKLISLFQKRYKIWKEIYFNGKNSSASFINL